MANYEPVPQEDDIPDYHIQDDDDNADQTGAFGLLSSTPVTGPEFQTAQKEKGGLHLPEPLSFLEHLSELPSLSTTTSTASREIDKEFPNADKNKIKFMMDRKGRMRVGLINPKKPYYNLLTQVPGKSGEYRINPQLPKEVLRALGESRRQTIQEEIERLSEGINEIKKKIAEDTTEGQTERNKARERAQIQISSKVDLQRQLDQLKSGEYTRDGGGQSISVEVFQKNEEERQEKEKQLRQKQEEREKNHK